MHNTQVLLRNRPFGIAQADDFEVVSTKVVEPTENQIVVRNAYLSVEPAMRGWIADTAGYSQPVKLGSVMRALAAGEIIKSNSADFAVGDKVTGWFGWQEIATVSSSSVVRKLTETDIPLSLSLGVLGINGVTAMLALRKIGMPVAGNTVLVSTAAGSVGSVVGQIAKSMGCRTIGITGSDQKVQACLDEFGYDIALDYHDSGLDCAIAEACPDGVDVYFDNTAGSISDSIMRNLALGARIVVCGTASIESWSEWPSGPRVERHLLVKRARMEGFIIFDHMDEYESAVTELAKLVRERKIGYREHFLEGIAQCPGALAMLYRGENEGKLLIKL